MSSIAFSVVWTDSDGMLQLRIKAASATHSADHETYVYPDTLSKFASALVTFPSDLSAEAILECGSRDPQWHDYLRIRVFVLKRTGHSAMEFESDVRGVPPVRARTHFYAAGEPADFNRLGNQLHKWADNPVDELVVEWRDA